MTCVSCLTGLRYVEPWLQCVVPCALSFFFSLLSFLLLFPCDARCPSQLLKEMSVIGSHWSVCDPVVFTHLQCGLEPRNLDGLGSCWCRRRARRIGQRELLLPCAWKSLICVACLAFSFLLALSDFAFMSARQTNRPKRALTSMCMEITYMCRLLGLFLSPCFVWLCFHVAVMLAWLPHKYCC